jgi:hypothetical protein
MKLHPNLKLFIQIFFLSIILTSVLTYPFMLKFKEFYTDQTDYPTVSYRFLTYIKSIEKNGLFAFSSYTSSQFYPFAYSSATLDLGITPLILYFPIIWLIKDIVTSTNIFSFLILCINFIISFYSLYYFIKDKKSCILGATVYSYNPYLFSHFPQGVQTQAFFYPLIILSLSQLFNKNNIKNALFFGSMLLLNSLISVYFQIQTITMVGLFIIPFVLKNIIKKNTGFFLGLIKTFIILIPFMLLILYFDYPYIQFAKMEGVKRTINEANYYSARAIDFISSTPNNLLYGNFVRSNEKYRQPREYDNSFNFMEHTLFLNIVPSILFLIGMLSKFNKLKKGRLSVFDTGLLIILFFSFILMWGPYLIFGNITYFSIKLPYYFLYQIFPFFKGMRVTTRFEQIFYIPFVFYIVYGSHLILIKKPKIANIVFILSLGLIIFENLNLNSYSETTQLQQEIIDYRINQKQIIQILKNKKTAHFPSYIPIKDKFYKEIKYLTWISNTDEYMLNSFSYLPPDWIKYLNSINNRIDDQALLELKAMNVDYVIIHKNFYRDELPELYNLYFNNNTAFPIQYVIYDDKLMTILDLSKITVPVNHCAINKDFKFNVQIPAYSINFRPIYENIILENQNNCYLFTQLENRYVQSKIYINGKYSRSVIFKIPYLIRPYEKYIISEIINQNNDYFEGLKRGNNTILTEINKLGIYTSFNTYIDEPVITSTSNSFFSKLNSISSNQINFQINSFKANKNNNSLIIDAQILNKGDSIWINYADFTNSNNIGAVILVEEYLNAEKKPILVNGKNPLYEICTNNQSTDPGKTAYFYCQHFLDINIINEIKYVKLYPIISNITNTVKGNPAIFSVN